MTHTRSLTCAAAVMALLSACAPGAADQRETVARGQTVYTKECAACHGSSGMGGSGDVRGPDLTGLRIGNDGAFPREYVRSFVMGISEIQERDPAMPQFARVGLRHVYPDGGADGEVLEADFENLIAYLEAIQR